MSKPKNTILDEDFLEITDELGNVYRYEILLTYEHEGSGVSYVLFFDPETPEEILVARYYEDGHLEDDLTEEEYAEAEEVLNAFETEEDEENA
ncbi:MAG: DUF1292 domain-containing protein [Bacilli bacterium]